MTIAVHSVAASSTPQGAPASSRPDEDSKPFRLPDPAVSIGAAAPVQIASAGALAILPPATKKSASSADAKRAPGETDDLATAQGSTSAAAFSAVAQAQQQLVVGHGEKPNEVNLAGRAADKLAAPRDPLRLIPSELSPAADTPSKKQGGAAGEGRAKPAAAPVSSPPTPEPPASSPDSRAEVGMSAVAVSARVSSTPGPVQGAAGALEQPGTASSSRPAEVQTTVKGIEPAAARATPGPAAAQGSPIEARADRSTPHGAMVTRDRLWQRLERLAPRPERAGTPLPARGESSLQPAVQAQFARGLAAALRGNDGQVTVRLAPEALGKLRIDLAISDERLTANIAAASEPARRLLSENLESLRSALESAGLNVEHIEVVGAPAEPASQPNPEPGTVPATHAFSFAAGDHTHSGGSHGHHLPQRRERGVIHDGDGDALQKGAASGGEPADGRGATYFLRIDFLA